MWTDKTDDSFYFRKTHFKNEKKVSSASLLSPILLDNYENADC